MKRFKTILTKVLQLQETEIIDTLTPADVEAWDSMNALILVSELERTFKIKFTYADITGVKCVGDIKAALARYGVQLQPE